MSGRYSRDYVVEGKPYEGHDRHNAEIMAFHLSRYPVNIFLYLIFIYDSPFSFLSVMKLEDW